MIYSEWVNIIYPIEPEFNIEKYINRGIKYGETRLFYKKMCEKPTPLGVGWIAQKNKTMCM